MTATPSLFLTRRSPEPGPTILAPVFEVRGGTEDRAATREEILAGVAGVDAILCFLTDRIDQHVMDAAGPQLRVISNFAVGYDNIDVAAATERGVLVTNTPGVLTDATADLAWALILAVSRRVAEGDHRVRAGVFDPWGPFVLLGRQVFGATLGIVGIGRIGKAVARRAQGFNMKVLYTRAGGPLPDPGDWEYKALDDLLLMSDFVSVHVPLSDTTRHLIGARELALMRPGAFLVNTARGPVVDERALVEALREGHLGGAGLDVYENEPRLEPGLTDLANVVLLPHVGSATIETRSAMARLSAENAVNAILGKPVAHRVNSPACQAV
jgi:glyoxylate reductase